MRATQEPSECVKLRLVDEHGEKMGFEWTFMGCGWWVSINSYFDFFDVNRIYARVLTYSIIFLVACNLFE